MGWYKIKWPHERAGDYAGRQTDKMYVKGLVVENFKELEWNKAYMADNPLPVSGIFRIRGGPDRINQIEQLRNQIDAFRVGETSWRFEDPI